MTAHTILLDSFSGVITAITDPKIRTIILPRAEGLPLGKYFIIDNKIRCQINVKSSGSSKSFLIEPDHCSSFVCINNSIDSIESWKEIPAIEDWSSKSKFKNRDDFNTAEEYDEFCKKQKEGLNFLIPKRITNLTETAGENMAKINPPEEMEEYLNDWLGEDCYLHDMVSIGNKTYYIYEFEYIEKFKKKMLEIYEELSKASE